MNIFQHVWRYRFLTQLNTFSLSHHSSYEDWKSVGNINRAPISIQITLTWQWLEGAGSPVNSPHKGQWRGASMFFDLRLNNDWVSNREAGDLIRYRSHYDVIVMQSLILAIGHTVEPLWKSQECLTKVAKFGPFPCTILYNSCFILPLMTGHLFWKATILVGLYRGVPLYKAVSAEL